MRSSFSPIPPTSRAKSPSIVVGGGSPALAGSAAQDPEATALRWLQTSATRPKRHLDPERPGRGSGRYYHAHLEILTVGGEPSGGEYGQ